MGHTTGINTLSIYYYLFRPDRIKSMLENTGFRILSLDGVLYNPITHNMSLSRFDCINYMLCAKKVNSI